MDNLYIAKTEKTPGVEADFENGFISIFGRSIPENSIAFYSPLLHALKQYAVNPKETTTLQIHMDYFNTSSSKCLLDVLRVMPELAAAGSQVKVVWVVDEGDEDMLEAGEDYAAIVNVPFEFEQK